MPATITQRLRQVGFPAADAASSARQIEDIRATTTFSPSEKKELVRAVLRDLDRHQRAQLDARVDRLFAQLPESAKDTLASAAATLGWRPARADRVQDDALPVFARPMEKAMRDAVREWNGVVSTFARQLPALRDWALEYNGLVRDVSGMKATELLSRLQVTGQPTAWTLADEFVG